MNQLIFVKCCDFFEVRTRFLNTGWSKSHANHVEIFIDGCNSIQSDWINKHTVWLWLYKSARRSRHVVTCSRQSFEVQGCLFHKCNECSLSNTTWHLVLTYFVSMSLGIHFPILLCQTNRQYLVWWTVSVTHELFTGCIKHEKSECSHRWTRWTFPTLHITFCLFSDFSVIYFLTNRTCVRNGLRDFSITVHYLGDFRLQRVNRRSAGMQTRLKQRKSERKCLLGGLWYFSLQLFSFLSAFTFLRSAY
jgi:hypothetical protein